MMLVNYFVNDRNLEANNIFQPFNSKKYQMANPKKVNKIISSLQKII